MERYTHTETTGYGENIGNSFKGMLLGFVLIAGAIVLLWWNESNSVEQAQALGEMQKNIITLPNTKYYIKYDNKAVLLTGEVKPLNRLIDKEFGVSSDGLILAKKVQMYQWRETSTTKTEDKLGGGTEEITTYDYSRVWSESYINSSSFHHSSDHRNSKTHYKSKIYATDATLGDYQLGENIIKRIDAKKEFNGLKNMSEEIGEARNHKSFLYVGYNPQRPRIGDIKITYTYAPSAIYTFVGKSFQKDIIPFVTSNGKSFLFVREGKVDANTIFTEAKDANATLTWILRGVGLLMMFIGFGMIMGPLTTLANVLPFLGFLVGGVTSVVAGVFTLILGSLVIAIAWFGARPMLSLGIIAVGVVIALALGKFGKKDRLEEE
ncbi:MAG: TMEM43 family protein [Sulfurovum sp.]